MKTLEDNRLYQREYYLKHRATLLADQRLYYQRNREKIRQRSRDWKRRNRDRHRAYTRRWTQENRAHKATADRQYQRAHPEKRRAISERYWLKHRDDPHFAMKHRAQVRICHALRQQGADKGGRFAALVGCSPVDLHAYIERLFQPGMTWDNRRLWHIDHIRPCASFDLADPEQQRACFHFSNLQPLWREHNLRKGAKYAST